MQPLYKQEAAEIDIDWKQNSNSTLFFSFYSFFIAIICLHELYSYVEPVRYYNAYRFEMYTFSNLFC